MRDLNIMTLLSLALCIAAIPSMASDGIDGLNYVDISGDAHNEGLPEEYTASADILSLELLETDGNISIILEVEGAVVLDEREDIQFQYQIFLRQSESFHPSASIFIIGDDRSINSIYRTDELTDPNVFGNGTNQLLVEISTSDILADEHLVKDISAKVRLTDPVSGAFIEDHINDGFKDDAEVENETGPVPSSNILPFPSFPFAVISIVIGLIGINILRRRSK